ncbi:hypothetical protein OHT68_30290 [Streptomyces canus]|uniref:hypothetical protein n=1 Tax=Streptomyces canus TaxID=58343 RepID=UPI002E291B49|nr:hypothetical protein [Streptomyces canus]
MSATRSSSTASGAVGVVVGVSAAVVGLLIGVSALSSLDEEQAARVASRAVVSVMVARVRMCPP